MGDCNRLCTPCAAAPPDPAAGVLLAALVGRQDALAAAGLAAEALTAATQAAWATAQPLQPGSFAAALCAYAINLAGSLRCRGCRPVAHAPYMVFHGAELPVNELQQ
jgi:hypothetical protein